MLRVLFCMSCCSAPPSNNRPARGKANVTRKNEKLVEEADFKSLLSLGTSEKESLLTNQIQANNLNYGAKGTDTQGTQGDLIAGDANASHQHHQLDQQSKQGNDSSTPNRWTSRAICQDSNVNTTHVEPFGTHLVARADTEQVNSASDWRAIRSTFDYLIPLIVTLMIYSLYSQFQ